MPEQAQGQKGIYLQTIGHLSVVRGVVSTRLQPLYPRKDPIPSVQEAGSASLPVWTARKISPDSIRSPDLAMPTVLPRPPFVLWHPDLRTTFIFGFYHSVGTRGGAVCRGTALHAGRSWVPFPMGFSGFFIDLIFLAALWPWGRLSV
jgi:hypothetical protein